ncbi:MAG TPA: hypothetical protein VIV60_25475, partial [Polyangiaceae bacterium]
TFGQEIELGEVLAAVQKVAGVLSVKALVFKRLSAPPPNVLSRIALGATEIARLDADELNPQNGRLIVLLPGLDEVDPAVFLTTQTANALGATS